MFNAAGSEENFDEQLKSLNSSHQCIQRMWRSQHSVMKPKRMSEAPCANCMSKPSTYPSAAWVGVKNMREQEATARVEGTRNT